MKAIITGRENTYDIEMLINAFYPLEKIYKVNEIVDDPTIVVNLEEAIATFQFFNNQLKVYEKKYQLSKSENKSYKLSVKRCLYMMLAHVTKKTLPWGILTGIRPVKIPLEWMEKGLEIPEIIRRLKEEYLITEEKIELMLEIASIEMDILRPYDEMDYSLYIGIPFCPTRCLYCSFTAFPIPKSTHMTDLYLDALEKEIDYTAKKLSHKRLRTIYIGGGTPTSLTDIQLDRLLAKISRVFDLTYLDEWTVEAGRPDSITYDKLMVLKKHPITRISINPQTMNQKTLEVIGRKHTVEQVIETFRMARDLGFENINMDIILGLPEETALDVQHTLKQIQGLEPDSITVHTLAIKRGSKLDRNVDEYETTSTDETEEMNNLTMTFASEQNMKPYYLYRQKNMIGNLENIGYAKEGKASIYNVLIMEEKQTIMALGAGAFCKVIFPEENRIERIENVKNVPDYVNRIDEMIQRKEDFFNKNY
jgi:oxygen-independent coproporphyrinogen-3 oxidase